MEFKPIKTEDRDKITEYFKHIASRNCDMSFAAVYLWKDFYRMEYAETDGMIVFCSRGERTTFSTPIGPGRPDRAIRSLREYCAAEGIPLIFHSVSREMEEYFNREMPGEFEIAFDRDAADYIYETESLIGLKGKKYHGKKNHINKFKKTYDWAYERISKENVQECLEMLEAWKEENCDPEDREKHAEICVSKRALLNREYLGLRGGLLRADGRVVAFSLGEPLSEDTFVVHIEKAYADVPGAYPMINQQFLLHEAAQYRYVNREDDCGEEGLRKAKLSYHPAFLFEKAIAVCKCCGKEQPCRLCRIA